MGTHSATVKVIQDGRITIPTEIREVENIKEGNFVKIDIQKVEPDHAHNWIEGTASDIRNKARFTAKKRMNNYNDEQTVVIPHTIRDDLKDVMFFKVENTVDGILYKPIRK